MSFDIRGFLKLVEAMGDDFLINPKPHELRRFFRKVDIGRAAIDRELNLIIWDAYTKTHDEVYKLFKIENRAINHPLARSLYAFKGELAVRAYDVDDEGVHPQLTQAARNTPSIVQAYGPDVEVIDIHGEP